MSQRHFSVVILPDRWDGSSEELARRLVSMTHQPAARLAKALDRGALTIDADLRREEAERLCGQLDRLGVPAEARDDSGEVVVATDAGSGPEAEEAPAPEKAGDPEDFEDFSELGETLDAIFESADLGSESESSFDELESVGGVGLDDGSGPTDRETAGASASGTESGGWDEVLGEESKDGGAPSTEHDPEPPASTEPELAARDGRGEGLELFDEADGSTTPSLEDLGGDAAGEESDAAAEAPADTSGDARAAQSPLQPPSPGIPGGEPEEEFAQPPSPGMPDGEAESAPSQPASPGPPETSERDSSGFDSVSMSEALAESQGESQFGGEFDDGPEHVPALAAVLSALAPGAGQIYNGEPEKAWRDTTSALLIVPWYRSVRDALEHARAIRQRQAPRPPEGSFVASLKHLAIIQVAIITFAVGGYFGVRAIGDQLEPEGPTEPTITATDVRRAVTEVQLRVHGARIDAWERAGKQRVSEAERFTMSEVERAERLFDIGLEHCRTRDLEMCESTMRKVSGLDSPFRKRAYSLQTWASVQQQPNVSERPMPDVGVAGRGTSREIAGDAGSGATGENVADEADAATLTGDPDAGSDAGAGDTSGD